MSKVVKCKVCGKTFKNEAGLSGHMRFAHREQRIKTVPDKLGSQLDSINHQINFLAKVLDKQLGLGSAVIEDGVKEVRRQFLIKKVT